MKKKKKLHVVLSDDMKLSFCVGNPAQNEKIVDILPFFGGWTCELENGNPVHLNPDGTGWMLTSSLFAVSWERIDGRIVVYYPARYSYSTNTCYVKENEASKKIIRKYWCSIISWHQYGSMTVNKPVLLTTEEIIQKRIEQKVEVEIFLSKEHAYDNYNCMHKFNPLKFKKRFKLKRRKP